MDTSTHSLDTLDIAALLAGLEEKLANIESERLALETKEAALRESIASIRKLIAVESGEVVFSQSDDVIVPKRAFKGMLVVEAIEKYLRMAKTGRTMKEIAKGLKQGGIETRSQPKHFISNLRTAIRRQGGARGIVQRGGKFWLADWPHTPKEQEADKQDDSAPPNAEA